MKGITPFFWFDDQAEETVSFYTSVFKRSRVGTVTRYGVGQGPRAASCPSPCGSIRRVGPAASEGRVPGPGSSGR